MGEMQVEYTPEQLTDRYLAIKEINSVLCARCLYFARRQQDLELERLWCKRAPEPHFAQNNGMLVGYEALKNIYGSSERLRKERTDAWMDRVEPEFAGQPDEIRYGTQTLSLQTLSTPCVEIAGDGETAKGLWTILGQVTAGTESGPVGLWAFGKCGADLVLEEWGWKIWHLMVVTDLVTPAGEAFDPEAGAAIYPAGLGIDADMVPMEIYSLWNGTGTPVHVPAVPVPYRTFSDTFSY